MLVDSLAVELYLKCLFVPNTDKPPLPKHDWQLLFDSLNSYTKTAIREAFEQVISSDPVLSHLDVINPEALKVTDFERSLTAARNTFDRRRYLYEEVPEGKWFYAHLIKDAIRAVTRMDIRLAKVNKV